tara:strand:- start:234 stop:920 length:687 start_codon:yes stop_codon:yes gene_type:complete
MNRKIRNALEQFCVETFGVKPDHNAMEPMVDALDRQVLHNYFGNTGNWRPDNKNFKASGEQLIEKVNALRPDSVLDIGCGYNLLKGKIKNLWGIDPYNTEADEVIDLMDIRLTGTNDVVLCLGSINFGDQTEIERKVAKAVSLCKPGGSLFWRVNPGLTHSRAGAEWVDFFEWNEDKLRELAIKNDCVCVDVQEDRWRDDGEGLRYYAQWNRNRNTEAESVSLQNMGR